MLNGGAEVIRLLSRKAQVRFSYLEISILAFFLYILFLYYFGKGCGTFKDCSHGGIHLDAHDPKERMRNW
jgi:hypothetical protein